MNEDTFKGMWEQMKGKVKEKWGQLTDDEIREIDGRSEILKGKLQQKYGYTKDQVDREFDDFFNRDRSAA